LDTGLGIKQLIIILFVISIASSLAFLQASASHGEDVDQSNLSSVGNVGFSFDDPRIMGQQFVPSATLLTSVDIQFLDTQSVAVGPTSDVKLTIWKSTALTFDAIPGDKVGEVTVNGIASGTAISDGSANIGIPNEFNAQTVNFAFAAPLTLVSGDTYVISLTSASGDGSETVQWRSKNGYAGGACIHQDPTIVPPILDFCTNTFAGIDDAAFQTNTSADLTLENACNDIEGIINNTFDLVLKDKLEDALQSCQTALTEFNKTPSDNQAAAGNIEGAIGDIEASIGLVPAQNDALTSIMDDFAGIARQLASDAIDAAISGGGDAVKIADAQQSLADGDTLRASAAAGALGDYKDAASKYKDAIAKAESA